MAATILGITLASCFVSGLIGMAIASSKGRKGAGFALGFFLGPIGWIISALLTSNLRALGKVKCQYCQEWVSPKATVCPHCQKQDPVKTA
jgi:hypothetical protein